MKGKVLDGGMEKVLRRGGCKSGDKRRAMMRSIRRVQLKLARGGGAKMENFWACVSFFVLFSAKLITL